MQEDNLQPCKQNDLKQTTELQPALEQNAQQKQIFKKKIIFGGLTVVILFFAFLGRLFYLQKHSYAKSAASGTNASIIR